MNFKNTLLISFILIPFLSFAQSVATKQISIEGEVKKELQFSIADFGQFQEKNIGELVITNHRGEPRKTLEDLKGIPIVKILQKLEFKVDSPKYLSEFYFIFEASDGYQVVYSWNELFNSETGKHTYIITQEANTKIEDIEDGILSITTSDDKTGRRHVKFLKRIIVKRV